MSKYCRDSQAVCDIYNENYMQYGYSAKSLGWMKGKQNIRFEQLLKYFNLKESMNILDIGCGFGDLNKYLAYRNLREYQYTGIDLVENFVDTAKERYRGNDKIHFVCGDFLNCSIGGGAYDYAIASGIFNMKLQEKDNYKNIEEVLEKALALCKDDGAVAFDFQSDKVDFIANDIVFHNSPEKVLEIAYRYSRNVILDNSYMPFEFALIVFKEDSFDRESTTFHRFISENKVKYEEGLFSL